MLKAQVEQILKADPEYAGIASVIEKEILHHDIMDVLVRTGAMQSLTFIGGTSLRLCYNSSRLSEYLDFNGGHEFKPSNFHGLESEIKYYIEKKYETEVFVNKPNEDKQGNTSSWKISIEKDSTRPDLPRQKMHIDVCAIPSFDVSNQALINHYNILSPTEGLLVPVQSLAEIFVDKFIALAYRSRRIKPRDVWDIVWINQKGVSISQELINLKLGARGKDRVDFDKKLIEQSEKLTEESVKVDFMQEMNRFVPLNIKERTLDNPDYWPYVVSQVQAFTSKIVSVQKPLQKFDMG